MALPSQTERSSEIGRSYVYKKNGSGSRKVYALAGVGVLVCAGAVWGLVRLAGAGPANANASPAGPNPAVTPANASPDASLAGKTPGSKSVTGNAPKGEIDPATGMPKIQAKATLPKSPYASDVGAKPAADAANGATEISQGKAAPTPAPTTPTPSPSPTSTPPTAAGAAPGSTPVVTAAGQPGANPAGTTTGSSPETGKPSAVDLTNESLTATPAEPTGAGGSPGSGVPGTSAGSGTEPLVASSSTAEVRGLMQQAEQRQKANDLVGARTLYSRALRSGKASAGDEQTLRDRLQTINDDLVFSSKIYPGDTMVEEYAVKPSDALIRIAKSRELATDWRLIQRVNRMSDPGKLRVGQKLKLVKGPFHAIVDKSDYRLDLFHGSPDAPEDWTFIRSFKVGLGAGNSTPTGDFIIRKNSKLVDPHWVNPQTGEKFDKSDPKNPIGEYWLGFQGVGKSAAIEGYGLHGTIEPDSIGKQKSMGCVRLADEDIKLIYEVLVEQISTVKIRD